MNNSTCIARDCGRHFDTAIPETRDTTTLRSFWQRYCYDCRTKGNAGTPVIVNKPVLTHYIAMSGSHGCLPDSCNAYEYFDSAVNELADIFELGRTRKARLYAERTLELSPDDGAEYCEITECHCNRPWAHCDAGDDPRDWEEYGRESGMGQDRR
jgi:hypothetical protein